MTLERRAGFPRHQLDSITATDQSSLNDGSIERQLAPDPLDDARQHATVVRQRVGIEGGHDAAPAQVLEPDHYLADSQATTLPVSLLDPMDTADDEIGPQSTAVVAKGADGSVGWPPAMAGCQSGWRVRLGTGERLCRRFPRRRRARWPRSRRDRPHAVRRQHPGTLCDPATGDACE